MQQPALKRKLSIKPDPAKERYHGRPEVWTEEVKELFKEGDDGAASIITQVLERIRRYFVAETIPFR